MKTSAMNSRYVIDGSVMDKTPSQILDAVCREPHGISGAECENIIDESLEPGLLSASLDAGRMEEYLDRVMEADCPPGPAYADVYARLALASALEDSLWRGGHLGLADIEVRASWKWNIAPVGAASAFYSSAQALALYLDELDLKLASYDFSESACGMGLSVSASLSPEAGEDAFMEDSRSCPASLVPDAQSWLVYIPFDTCEYRLGGSLLTRCLGIGGGVAPQTGDADYFIDCYEVVRELVEDGVVLSGTGVGEGGLLKAVKSMTSGGTGISIDISDIMKSSEENNVLRVLFAEVPGVLVQIRDMDFDYLDAELLLQDVAFFPLGHPIPGSDAVRIRSSRKSGIERILDSLIQNAEGED